MKHRKYPLIPFHTRQQVKLIDKDLATHVSRLTSHELLFTVHNSQNELI